MSTMTTTTTTPTPIMNVGRCCRRHGRCRGSGFGGSSSSSAIAWILYFLVVVYLVGCSTALYDDATDNDNDNGSHVIVLKTMQDLEQKVLSPPNGGVWMIQFYWPESAVSQKFVPTYELLANLTAGLYRVAAVDFSTEEGKKMAAFYDVAAPQDDLPDEKKKLSLVLLAEDKKNPVVMNTPHGGSDIRGLVEKMVYASISIVTDRAAEQGLEDVASMFSSSSSSSKSGTGGGGAGGASRGAGSGGRRSNVMILTDDNFDEMVIHNSAVVAVAFTAPWCGYCKQLHPEWEAAAAILAKKAKGNAVLGWMDATTHEKTAGLFRVEGYPTIKIFPGGSKTQNSMLQVKDFPNVERNAASIVQVILAEVEEYVGPADIPELTNKDVLDEHCSGANHICVLAALPHILDSGAEGRNKYKDLLQNVSKTFRGTSSYSFMWFEGGSQPALENAMELTFGYPAVAALSVDRQAYAVLRGSFREKSITAFLFGIINGRQATQKLPNSVVPEIVATQPWDGKDGQVEEEEFSLEDIMGDDDFGGGDEDDDKGEL